MPWEGTKAKAGSGVPERRRKPWAAGRGPGQLLAAARRLLLSCQQAQPMSSRSEYLDLEKMGKHRPGVKRSRSYSDEDDGEKHSEEGERLTVGKRSIPTWYSSFGKLFLALLK